MNIENSKAAEVDLIAKENVKMLAEKKAGKKSAPIKTAPAPKKTAPVKAAEKAEKKPDPKKTAKEKTPKKISKVSKIRDMFAEKKNWSVQEIMKRSGFDRNNTKTAMSILRNKNRTKDLLTTDYDKEKEIFTLVK